MSARKREREIFVEGAKWAICESTLCQDQTLAQIVAVDEAYRRFPDAWSHLLR